MNYDRVMYIFYSVLTLIAIFICSIFTNYGYKIIDEPTFKTYFSWFIGIILFNLFNMLIIFIFYYFKTDLIGPKGLKGEPGPRGQHGKDVYLIDNGGASNVGSIECTATAT